MTHFKKQSLIYYYSNKFFFYFLLIKKSNFRFFDSRNRRRKIISNLNEFYLQPFFFRQFSVKVTEKNQLRVNGFEDLSINFLAAKNVNCFFQWFSISPLINSKIGIVIRKLSHICITSWSRNMWPWNLHHSLSYDPSHLIRSIYFTHNY